MNGFGGGFGGNLGGFQLPDFSGIDLEGIAAQVAKYTAEQDLANATNEYEKDAAETKLSQVKEYESGIAELPPIAEQVMEQMQNIPIKEPTREDFVREDFVDYEIDDPVEEFLQQIITTTDPIVKPDFGEFVSQVEPYDFGEAGSFGTIPTIPTPPPPPPPEDNEPQVRVDKAQLEDYYNPYNDGYEDYIDEEPVDPIYEEPVYVPPPVDSLPEIPGIGMPADPAPVPENPYEDIGALPIDEWMPKPVPLMPPPDPIYGREDPAAQTGSEAIFDPGYVRENPAISNLIQQQRAAYGDALKRAVYKAPDRVQDDYVRPMSAAEFGSVPGRYTPPTGTRPYVGDPGFAQIQQDPALLPIAMNHGGSLNLNSSSLNRGIGQLPPMQQNDKLTQLFAQSFNPRR